MGERVRYTLDLPTEREMIVQIQAGRGDSDTPEHDLMNGPGISEELVIPNSNITGIGTGTEIADELFTQFVDANRGLVVKIAIPYLGKGLSDEELYHAGVIGMSKSLNPGNYNPSLGVPFASYGKWFILSEIQRAVKDYERMSGPIILSYGDLKKYHQVNATANTLTQQLGRFPTTEEVAKGTQMDPDIIRELRDSSRAAVSLDQPAFNAPDAPGMGERIADPFAITPEEHYLVKERKFEIRAVLRQLLSELSPPLSPKQSLAIEQHLGLQNGIPLTFEAIGPTRQAAEGAFKLGMQKIRTSGSSLLQRLRELYEDQEDEST